MSQDWETPRRARSRLRAAAAGLAVVIAVSVLIRPADPSTGTDGALEVTRATPTPTPTPTRTPRITPVPNPSETPGEDEGPELTGTWQRIADLPTPPPEETTIVHDGRDGVYVVGGQSWNTSDGGTRFHEGVWRYDVAQDAWTALPPSPLAPRAGVSAAWTGSELVVWGGMGRTRLHADGAAFDPAGGTWRMLAEAPLSPRQGATAGWTGDGVLVAGGMDFGGGLADGAIWHPERDTWTGVRELPSTPTAWGPWGRSAPAVRVGDNLLVAHTGPTIQHAGPSLVTPLWLVDDGWVATELPDRANRHWMVALAARSTGDVVGMTMGTLQPDDADLVVLPHGSDRWERLDEPPPRSMDPQAGALVADRYLVVAGSGGIVAYDLVAGTWLQLPDGGPADGSGLPQVTVVALSDGFLLLPWGRRFVLADGVPDPAEDATST